MGSQVFTGAKRALLKVPMHMQTEMYQQHFASASKRATTGAALRSSRHRVTDSSGTQHVLTVVSAQSPGQRAADVIVLNQADTAEAVQYVRQYQQQRRRQ